MTTINTQTVQAVNVKNQGKVNKATRALIKHNEVNSQRDLESDTNGDDTAKFRRLERVCEESFEKYLNYCEELPKYEVKNIEKSELY
jgi:cytochrome b involved in lipid metabolism